MSWPVFLSAFTFTFVAALPGRTTFVMLIMAARGHPVGIFLGSAMAFACQSVISVLLGTVLALLPEIWVQLATGTLFLFFAFAFWRESNRDHSQDKVDGQLGRGNLSAAIRSSFLVVFAAEWGDVSQVAIASLSARNSERVSVFVSAILALWLIAAISVFVGSHLKKFIQPARIQKIASFVFLGIGIYMIGRSIHGY